MINNKILNQLIRSLDTHPVMFGRMFGIPPPWMFPMNPLMGPPMMPIGPQTSFHTGPPPWMYARQGCVGPPWQATSVMPGPNMPGPVFGANHQSWWHDGRGFDPADTCSECSPEDSEERKDKEEEPEEQPDLGPWRIPPAGTSMHSTPRWSDHMHRVGRSGATDPWLGYSPENLDVVMQQRYWELYNRNLRSDPPTQKQKVSRLLIFPFRYMTDLRNRPTKPLGKPVNDALLSSRL